jgi:UPF0755 protein
MPMPPRRSIRARHPLVIVGNALFTILVIVVVAGGVTFFIGKQWFDAAGPLLEDKVVNIPARSGTRDIAELLQREGVIDGPLIFVVGATALKLKTQSELKAGEYQFNKQVSAREAVETLLAGKAVQHLVTVAEGLTSEQIVQRLMDSDALSGNIKEIPREGTLLPESYKISRGMTREQLLQRMQQDQRRALLEVWERRNPDLPIRTPEQLVILASIIEKETGRPDERTRVAAVFVNRLKQRMRLQSDPTITYGLVGGKGSLGHPITRSELEQPTPYNTYVIDGLPPGPITNPGRASLEAAANPARTKEIYFVADGTGGHAFAETYEQHQKNVARLRSIEHQQRDTGAAEAQAAASNDDPAAQKGQPGPAQPPNGKKKK